MREVITKKDYDGETMKEIKPDDLKEKKVLHGIAFMLTV